MPRCLNAIVLFVALALAGMSGLGAQGPSAQQIASERAQAELDAPKLAKVLELKPGMTVADIGAGFGAMTVVLGKWIGSGHVFATDIADLQLRTIREYAEREGLNNVTVIEGAAASTNLPAACCDAIFLRHVYHHISEIDAFTRSLHASLKPGGRLAIIDFEARKGSQLAEGVPANRGGHGIPPAVVIGELTAPGLTHATTIDAWPPGDKDPTYFLGAVPEAVGSIAQLRDLHGDRAVYLVFGSESFTDCSCRRAKPTGQMKGTRRESRFRAVKSIHGCTHPGRPISDGRRQARVLLPAPHPPGRMTYALFFGFLWTSDSCDFGCAPRAGSDELRAARPRTGRRREHSK